MSGNERTKLEGSLQATAVLSGSDASDWLTVVHKALTRIGIHYSTNSSYYSGLEYLEI